MPDEHWRIDRYARFKSDKPENATQWTVYDDSCDLMRLMLSDVQQLVISQGSAILESHSLLSARSWMRGVCRNDSLLFMCKVQISGKNETRKFRVRFSAADGLSGSDHCSACVERLQQFFPVKMSVVKSSTATDASQNKTDLNGEAGDTSLKQQNLEGEVTLGDVAQNLLASARLPMAYNQHHINQETLQQMLRVCLADPAFPAFVQSVENELQNIVQNS
ncbi:hypothetical protein RRG08_036002 [Elysia crispata]|uniref:Meiotic recombination protein REC114 n=1 Tax=Elysia crispata TaxID=231223 RepID=A0AAE1AKQ5_9GAST|nr:hypothetical protein RRG08_036002 [Elysia crispata]